MSKKDLKDAVRSHDWSYQMSEDYQLWHRENQLRKKIARLHEESNCPFPIHAVKKWQQNMVLERFLEDPDNKGDYYFSLPPKGFWDRPFKRYDLLTQEEFDEIQNWFEEELHKGE